ncbi:DUF2288 domain-containing protein [Halopseudomonas phragmitis]|uniref:DUF2288 domain-containing protein n=2 Tax=Pseudomonadaceae TaxID=135621 RepID=A0A1V0B510_9GAMM|nr:MULTISPECIES: DUF2288 domain-containing protein [Pseudomonadaceae]AQZ94980.1 hypothetical protein BVH74_09555 [Halopseudomonas phragmitis]RHW23140.1 DUF2288 domain-containing protein [Pseudomonas jilinensis]
MTSPSETYAAILGSTGRIDWKTLEPHFARGEVLVVGAALDLVAVAQALTADDADTVKGWMDAGQFGPISNEQAIDWSERHPDNLWAVVIRPWVLVQERA